MAQFDPNTVDATIPRVRLAVLACIAIILLGVLIVRLYHLQVTEHEKHLKVSDKNRIDVRPLKPKRGLIYDRNGILIADNQPSFTLTLIPEKVEDVEYISSNLQKHIQLTSEQIDIIHKMHSIPRRPFEPLVIKDRLTSEEIAAIVVNQHTLSGVQVDAELRRQYPFDEITAHILGYVGHLSEEEKLVLTPERTGITHVGKKGIELAYETSLSGSPGHEFVETNARGRLIRTLSTSAPVPGTDLKLTIDMDFQKAMHDILSEHKRAAAVAINPKNGAVLGLVSIPSYNPNSFVFGISQKQFNTLQNNKLRPLFNRAVQGQYPPGSTIKPMIGLAALALGTTSWSDTIWDPGYFQIENQPQRYRDWKRWGHGRVNLERAIIESCDTFFYDIANRTNIDKLAEQLSIFNFGRVTGIDLTGESSGLFPTSTWKRRRFNQPWYPGETLIASIGQGYVLATPLQLAHATAILANNGEANTPHLVAQTRGHEKSSKWSDLLHPHEPDYDFDTAPAMKKHWQRMIEAMHDVVDAPKGTAQKISKDLKYTLAGKTGTSQVVAIAQNQRYNPDELLEEHRDHALFIGFAPVENPEIALAVIIENGGSGGAVAAPVARALFDAYLLKQEGNIQQDKIPTTDKM